MLTPTVEAEASLLRATQLLWAASLIEIGLDLPIDLSEVLLQDSIRILVWQAAALLPEGVPLDGAQPASPDLLATLEQVEAELRTRPIWEYPGGTSQLIVQICDVIGETRAGTLT